MEDKGPFPPGETQDDLTFPPKRDLPRAFELLREQPEGTGAVMSVTLLNVNDSIAKYGFFMEASDQRIDVDAGGIIAPMATE